MSTIKIYILGLVSFFIFLSISNINAQKFGGGVVIGFNASQIDGDRLAGYNKIGFNVGLNTSYDLGNLWQINIDFLFSQRGSQTRLIPYKYDPIRKITLNYIELPVYASYQDWWMEEEGYYKIQGFAGFSVGRLFSVKDRLNNPDVNQDNFVKNDLSFLLGTKFFLNKQWALTGRYTRSVVKLYKSSIDGQKSLLSYFLNFGILYKIL